MARGKRPVPFRTRKLSLSAPMVLPGGPGGRVGHRRTTIPRNGGTATPVTPFLRSPATHPDPDRGMASRADNHRSARRHVTEPGAWVGVGAEEAADGTLPD